MRILGIDPGIATIGFGLVEYNKNQFKLEKCGVITTPAHTSLSSRLNRIYADMNELLHFFTCEQFGVPIFEYTPLQVKQAVAGYGRAEKRQVMEMVRRICLLQDVPHPDDAADAIALAICHARSTGSLLGKGGSGACSTI